MGRVQFDILNEQAVLAAALKDPAARRKVLGAVKVEDFIGAPHRVLYGALLACGDAEVDTHRLMLRAGGKGDLTRDYIDNLFTLEVPAALDDHIMELLRSAARARMVEPAKKLPEALIDKTISHDDIERAVASMLTTLHAPVMARNTGAALAEHYMEDMRDRWEGRRTFQTTGYSVLDDVLVEGFAPGVFCVIAGRTRNGKSTVITDIVIRLLRSEDKPRILVLPLEVGATRFMDLLLSNAAEIDIDYIIKHPTEMKLKMRRDVQRKIEKLIGSDDRLVVLDNPFYDLINTDEGHTNKSAMDVTERLIATGDYDIVITDLWDQKLVDDRPHAISAALRREQMICQRYGICSIAVHQMRRDLEAQKDKRPTLTHLKGSGAWEERGGLILGVHREKAYKPHMTTDVIEVEVLKQKGGDAGFVMEADFEPWFNRLSKPRLADAERDPQPMFTPDEGEGSAPTVF